MAAASDLNQARSQDQDDLPAFSIPLNEVVSGSANLHTENDPNDKWQRETFTERDDGRVAVSCVCKDVIHGFYAEPVEGEDDGEDDQAPQACSLIVLHFRFDPVDLGRRIKKVEVKVRFSGINSEDNDPVVDQISPDETFWVYPTTQKETVTVGALGKAGANPLGVEVGGELKRDKVVEKEVIDAGRVRGAKLTIGRTYGKANTASWTLMENGKDKTGAPLSMRASILVKRDPGADFQVHFTMVVTPDNLSQAQTWFRSKPKDAPIFFKVDKKPTNRLHKYTVETLDKDKKHKLVNNLGKLDLGSPEFTDITFRKVWATALK